MDERAEAGLLQSLCQNPEPDPKKTKLQGVQLLSA